MSQFMPAKIRRMSKRRQKIALARRLSKHIASSTGPASLEKYRQKVAWSIARVICPPSEGEVLAARFDGDDRLDFTARLHAPIHRVSCTTTLTQ